MRDEGSDMRDEGRSMNGARRPSRDSHALSFLLVFAGLAVYLLLFYAAKLPSLGHWGDGLISRGELLFVMLFRFDEVVATWLGAPGEASLVDRVPVLAIGSLILACGAVVGWLLMWLCRADRGLTRLETFVFSTAVGLNAVSTYVLVVGLMGLVRNVFVFAVPAALAVAAAGWIWLGHRRREDKGSRRRDEGKRSGGTRRSSAVSHPSSFGSAVGDDWLRPRWLWLAVPFAIVILLGGMLPPVEFDVREYHLQVPKEFFQQGSVGFLPHNVYGNMPMGTEMLSLLAMALAGDWWLGALAGKTVIAAFAPLTALGLYAAGRRFFSTSVGVAAAIVYLSIPWIAQVSCLGLVEGALACYVFLAVYAVLLWREQKRNVHRVAGVERSEPPGRQTAGGSLALDPSHPGVSAKGGVSQFSLLGLGGYLAGGAVSCKYPAVLFVVAPLAIWILVSVVRDPGPAGSRARRWSRLAWKPLSLFLLAAGLGCGLWFAKNWAFTGNPTYPLLYEVFGDRTDTWTPAKNEQWNRVHRPHDFSPRRLAKDAARVLLTSEWLSPLVMPLAAFALLVRKKKKKQGKKQEKQGTGTFCAEHPPGLSGERCPGNRCLSPFSPPFSRRLVLLLAAYFGFVVLTWWLLTHRIDRFWIVVLPVVSLLAGVGACWSRAAVWRRVVVGLLVFASASSFLMVTSVAGGYTRYFVRLDRLREDPMRLDPWHRYFNTHARDGRVLVVGDAQVFDLEVPIVYSTCFDDSMFERWVKGRTAEEVRATFAREGITHVYVQWGEIARYRSPGNYGFTDFVQPVVFERLVDQGVLEPLPAIEGHPGRGYRVRVRSERAGAARRGDAARRLSSGARRISSSGSALPARVMRARPAVTRARPAVAAL
jgi:4-amino-4-deoxy-L-arabinose transferase-like glycosyltransferase